MYPANQLISSDLEINVNLDDMFEMYSLHPKPKVHMQLLCNTANEEVLVVRDGPSNRKGAAIPLTLHETD